MEIILGLLVGLFILVTCLIMPWVCWSRLRALEAEVAKLGGAVMKRPREEPVLEEPVFVPPAPVSPQPVFSSPILPPLEEVPEPEPFPSGPSTIPPATTPEADRNFERNFGAKLPVWIGAIALALAGYYLVRYSIEMGLLGPGMRTLLGLAFGAGLVGASRKAGPHNARIGQALAGAGIAVLYFALYAATSLHHLIPHYLGFAGMVGVTGLAMVMALRHGAPIAILGMMGGFLTPLMVGSEQPNVPLLLTYLYILFAALFYVIRRNAWWGLALLLAPFALVWAAILLLTAPASEVIFVGFFMLALGATVVAGTRGVAAEIGSEVTGFTAVKVSKILNYGVITLAAVMIGVATAKAGFGVLDRGLLLVLTASALGLAWFDYARYRFVPPLTLAISLFALAAWQAPDELSFRLTLALFAGLQIAVPGFLVWQKRQPLFWALLSTLAAAFFYLFAYARMGAEIERITLWPLIEPRFWGALALGLAAFAVEGARRVYLRSWDSDELRQQLLAVFAAAASGFMALALSIELEREFLSVAIAAEMLALCWLGSKLEVKALRPLAGLAALFFGVLLLPQIALLIQLSANVLIEARIHTVPIVNWPVFQLGLPALFFILGSLLLRKRADTKLVATFETTAIALTGLMGYYLMRQTFHPGENILLAAPASFIERGTITNVLMLFGLGCSLIAAKYERPAIARAALALIGIGVFRLFWLDLFIHNPMSDTTQNVGGWFLLNGLTLTYALPVLWLHRFGQSRPQDNRLAVWFPRIKAVLLFAFANLTLCHLFHGENLTNGPTSNAELYSYSLLWLGLALGLLVEGTRQHRKEWRMAALGLMLITVGKVFLIDAAELAGLWRVFSFLGLGLCLIGLSWFTTRFVVKED